MGLKNKLSKIKSFFIDEVEEETEVRPPIKKVAKKETKNDYDKTMQFEPKKVDRMDDLFFEDVSDVDVSDEIKPRSEKKEKEFSFPEFDDDDFAVSSKKPEPIIQPVRKEPKPVPLYQGSKRKEETKKFKPSPIISPIYGLLDEEGNSVKEEKETSLGYNDEVTFDEVRKKAYGKLDDELEDTIKRLSSKTIEEAEKEVEEKELSRTKTKEKKLKEEVKIISEALEEDDDDDMILPNVNFKEIDVDKETKKSRKKNVVDKVDNKDEEDDDDDTKEQDLFNLIDTMYQEEGDED